jgi:hypothetical protein
MAADRAQAVGVQQLPERLRRAPEEPRDLDLAISDLRQQRERCREVGLGDRADREQLDADPPARDEPLAGQGRRRQPPKACAHRDGRASGQESTSIEGLLSAHLRSP